MVNLAEEDSHYTGVLTLKEIPNKDIKPNDKEFWLVEDYSYKLYHIVDGQQRLTTFVIFLQAFVDLFRGLPGNKTKADQAFKPATLRRLRLRQPRASPAFATLNGSVNPGNATGSAYFQFGQDSSFGAGSYNNTSGVTVTAGTSAQAISISTLSSRSLSSGTTYYFRTVFNNGSNGEVLYGSVQSFKTLVITPTVSLSPASLSITTAQSLMVTISVNGGSGNPTPTGSVTLTGGGYTSTASPLSNGSAMINIPANSLSAGTDTLVVSYTPDSSSSSTYNSASGSVTVTVTIPAKTTPTVTVIPGASSITTTAVLSVT